MQIVDACGGRGPHNDGNHRCRQSTRSPSLHPQTPTRLRSDLLHTCSLTATSRPTLTSVHELVAVALPGGPAFIETLIRIWNHGDAILPVDPGLPAPALSQLFAALRPARFIDPSGDEHFLDDGCPVADGDALVMATSGSTGAPKGVVHTHDSIRASASATNTALGVDPTIDKWLCCLPLSHIGGFSVLTRSLASNTPIEIHSSFDAAKVEAAARIGGATLTSLVPTTLRRIDPTPFRRIVVGGSAPFVGLPDNAITSYGMTETGSAVVYDGRLLPEVEIRLADGEILVRGPMLMRCYRDASDPRDTNGWFATGDEGEWGNDGRLVVHGRRGDMITTGGEKVWPVAVEQVLGAHPAVREVAITGKSDPEWGQIVVAFVVPIDTAAPPTLDHLRAFVKNQLPAFMAPKQIHLVRKIPRTSIGKVRRTDL